MGHPVLICFCAVHRISLFRFRAIHTGPDFQTEFKGSPKVISEYQRNSEQRFDLMNAD